MLAASEAALADAGLGASELRAIGIANQRETTVLWDRATGRPVAPALVWQDRRTAARCAELPAELIRERTGLVPDPYFSATKLEWLLEHAGAAGDLAFGTIDSWLAWKLTGEHVTDVSNASRTLLLGLDELRVGRRASGPVRRAALRAPDRGLVERGARPGEALRRHRAFDGDRRRSAGRSLRPGLLRARTREGDVRNGSVRARERRAGTATAGGRRARDGRVATGGTRRPSTRSRAPSSSPAPRSSGCATGWG